MVDELAPDTNEKMRALCKKISVAHDLDAEIQQELYTHIEDKLLAYLNGEETLTEEDAFILVREHFGDPSALKGLLQDVHAIEAQVSLARRLAAAIVVTAGALVAYLYLTFAAFRFWPALHGNGGDYVLIAGMIPAYFVFPWLVLHHWQRRLDAGHKSWFLTCHPAYLVGAIAVLFVLESVAMSSGLLWTEGMIQPTAVRWLYLLVLQPSPVLQCMVWLWWCDRPPRTASAVRNAGRVWALWAFSLGAGANAAMAIKGDFAPNTTQVVLGALAVNLVTALMCAFVAYGLYVTARRVAAGSKRRLART